MQAVVIIRSYYTKLNSDGEPIIIVMMKKGKGHSST